MLNTLRIISRFCAKNIQPTPKQDLPNISYYEVQGKLFRTGVSDFNLPVGEFYRKNPWFGEPVLDLMEKHFRKLRVDLPLFEKQKVLVPVIRKRMPEDTIEKLVKEKLVALEIEERPGYPEEDLVIRATQIHAMKRRLNSGAAPFYLQFEDREIRCTLKEVSFHPIKKWVYKATLRRYIVGEENFLTLPIHVVTNFKNQQLNRGSDGGQNIFSVDVISYIDVYPTVVTIDIQNVSRARPYKLGDINNILPPGMKVHPRHSTQLHQEVVDIEEDPMDELKFQLFVQKQKQEEATKDKKASQKANQQEEVNELQMDDFTKLSELRKKEQAFLAPKVEKKEKKPMKERKTIKKEIEILNQKLKDQVEEENKQKANALMAKTKK